MKAPRLRCRMVRERGASLDLSPLVGGKIRGPQDVARLLWKTHFSGDPQESFVVIHLNTQHRPVSWEVVTRGILDASLVHPREIFRGAILASAAGIIIAHNHPSGDPTPSREDRVVTRQLSDAGKTIGIPVLDHVVVAGPQRFVSLGEEATR